MWLSAREMRRLLRDKQAAENRAVLAESALTLERKERMADVRHVISMWLRHAKSLPLTKSADEKAESKAEGLPREPPPPDEIFLAQRDAHRREAARHGVSEEDADKIFREMIESGVIEG